MAQVHAAIAAIDRMQRRERITRLIDARAAWAEPAAFEKHVRQLQRHRSPAAAVQEDTIKRADPARTPLSAQRKDHRGS